MKNNKMKQQKQMAARKKQEKWSVFVGSALACLLIISPTAYASDVEIYRQGTDGGNSTIMLMVDTSQGMGSPALDLLKDYPLCISGQIFAVVGALPVVDVKLAPPATQGKKNEAYCDVVFPKSVLDLLGTVDTVTGTQRNSLLGLQSSLDYMRASCIPFSKLEVDEPERSNTILSVNLSLGEGYRCYSRLSRIKMAVRDVLNGNNGITALPAKTTIGLSISPAKKDGVVNQKTGMIVVPAQELGHKKGDVVDGVTMTQDSAQRQALQTAIDSLVPSSDPLASTLNSVVNILKIVSNAVTLKLNAVDLVGSIGPLLKSILDLIGGLSTTVTALLENPESPLATTYAETGAYLLGTNTRGTGERLSEFEVPVRKSDVAYKCLSRQADNDCNSYEKKGGWSQDLKEYPVPTGHIRTEQITPSNGLLGDLLGSIFGWLSGNTDKRVIRYYYASDAIYSGYKYATNGTQNSDHYIKPDSIKPKPSTNVTTSQCQAQGILVLTGSIPKIAPADSLGVQRVMQKSLGQTPSNNLADFCSNSPAGWSTRGSTTATWQCIANYSQALLNTPTTPVYELKTGVAGIGKDFHYVQLNGNTVSGAGTSGSIVDTLLGAVKMLLTSVLELVDAVTLGLLDLGRLTNLVNVVLPTSLPADDVENLVHWGKDGKGGWYTEASTGGIAQSIIDFSQHIVDAESDPFMGLQTIPADPLTPYQLSDDVYNSIFKPTDHQSWSGNLKRYSAANTGTGDNIIRTVDWKDKWSSNTAEAADGSTLFKGGMLDQLKTLRPTKTDTSTRTLWINRNCDADGKFTESQSLKKVTSDYLNDSSEARCAIDATAKDTKGGYLMNLLGYNVDAETATGGSLATSEPFWKIGMPLHSTPLKITQFAKFNSNGSIARDDYIVFGSTQGLLHVVDADDGQEKFAFVPNEMLENSEQRKAFTAQSQGSWRNMSYGVDGAWTAHTEYVYGMKDGKVIATVDQVERGTNKPQGKQVLYGGLRMGGRSYYALDLTDLDNPKIKFHINPTGDCSNSNPLGCMGQSWSKPTIAYINWKGQRKQVMFVGGGYDMGYEDKDYNPSLSEGAGVYMFDANNGDLLWWASANATTKNTATENALNVTDMKYSVVSRINVADRNGDGLADHLYFGDLGGQVWRVDINANTATGDFAQRATLILNVRPSDVTKPIPRFYDAPSFSVYGYEKPLAVVSIASGNRSLPVSDPGSGAIYNIFDKDVTKTNLYTLAESGLETKNIKLALETESGGVLKAALTFEDTEGKNIEEVKDLIPHGWFVAFADGKKVLNEMAVINKNLYAGVYDPGITPTCPVQVRGETKVHRYCLPFGICEQELQTNKGQVNNFVAGKGIVALNVGSGQSSGTSGSPSRALIQSNVAATGSIPINTMRRQIVPLKWYESNE
ncbi:pilus assembly protein [Acinetobacter haemolyticus]|uniref:pilus assembly protein n=1 Tax=Acinetobacter haemolyticus TaxID=29430 RepID=UPI000DEAC6E9|nr:PilC/PilY family type IV pilus protein [Acinetobacter haemolyticus]WHR56702.1 PilC/PilY family type IV pilus protein [Acinetobacter haemolyticus]